MRARGDQGLRLLWQSQAPHQTQKRKGRGHVLPYLHGLGGAMLVLLLQTRWTEGCEYFFKRAFLAANHILNVYCFGKGVASGPAERVERNESLNWRVWQSAGCFQFLQDWWISEWRVRQANLHKKAWMDSSDLELVDSIFWYERVHNISSSSQLMETLRRLRVPYKSFASFWDLALI